MGEIPLIEHLNEFRKRFIVIIIFLFLFFLLGTYFSNFLIKKVIEDLLSGKSVAVIAFSPVEYVLLQLKIGLLTSLFLSSPVIFYELFLFLKPGLMKKEKNALKMIMPSFLLLLVLGAAFAYFVFLDITIYFLSELPIEQVFNLWSIDKLISFVFLVCFSFGLVFQTPLLILILDKLGLVNQRLFKKKRRIIYVLIFLAAAIITPPDAVTLLIMSLPLIVLYEISLFVINFL